MDNTALPDSTQQHELSHAARYEMGFNFITAARAVVLLSFKSS
jgi:hypothetical protein